MSLPMLTFATKKLSTGANGQKEDAAQASFFVRAVLIELSCAAVTGWTRTNLKAAPATALQDRAGAGLDFGWLGACRQGGPYGPKA